MGEDVAEGSPLIKRKMHDRLRKSSLRGVEREGIGSLSGVGHAQSFKGAGSSSTLSPIQRLKGVAQPLRKVKAVGEFKFEYSGGAGERYYREVSANVTIVVRPCLLFEQLEISLSSK